MNIELDELDKLDEGVRLITLGSLGKVEVMAPENAEFTYNEETGEIYSTIPGTNIEEEPIEVEHPTLITFTNGKLNTTTTYTPGTYETIEYEEINTVTAYPVSYKYKGAIAIVYCRSGECSNVTVDVNDIKNKSSNYIVFSNSITSSISINGYSPNCINYYSINNTGDDTLENAIYLAAYLKHTDKNNNDYYVGMWSSSNYVKVNCDDEINAITTFTRAETTTKTKQVQITEPSSSSKTVYVPTGSYSAEEGMTWNEWISSEYNVDGYTASIRIKDSSGNIVNKQNEIQSNEKYSILASYPASVEIDGVTYDVETFELVASRDGLTKIMDFSGSGSRLSSTYPTECSDSEVIVSIFYDTPGRTINPNYLRSVANRIWRR